MPIKNGKKLMGNGTTLRNGAIWLKMSGKVTTI